MKCFVFVEYRVQASVSTAEHQIGIFLKIKEVREKKKKHRIECEARRVLCISCPATTTKKRSLPIHNNNRQSEKKRHTDDTVKRKIYNVI